VLKVTERNVMVRYAGEAARLDRRKLWHWWAWYRAVRFVSSRSGRITAELDAEWWGRYGARGAAPPLADAIRRAMLIANTPRDLKGREPPGSRG
jgi:hypothetical protein